MGTGEFNAGGTLPWTRPASHPGGISRVSLQKPEIISGLMGHLARMQTLPLRYNSIQRLNTSMHELVSLTLSAIVRKFSRSLFFNSSRSALVPEPGMKEKRPCLYIKSK